MACEHASVISNQTKKWNNRKTVSSRKKNIQKRKNWYSSSWKSQFWMNKFSARVVSDDQRWDSFIVSRKFKYQLSNDSFPLLRRVEPRENYGVEVALGLWLTVSYEILSRWYRHRPFNAKRSPAPKRIVTFAQKKHKNVLAGADCETPNNKIQFHHLLIKFPLDSFINSPRVQPSE